jgi:GTP cyclohydrolase I
MRWVPEHQGLNRTSQARERMHHEMYMHAMCERHTVYIQINSLPAACVHFFPTARFYGLENLSKFVASIRRISPGMGT